MSGFEDREKGFEAKFGHDQETRFKVMARRNRLLGEWAAEQMGLGDDQIDAYAKDVVASDFDKPGEDDVVEKVLGDFTAKGVSITETDLRKKMDELVSIAHEQIMESGK